MVDVDTLLKKDAFKNIDSERADLLRELMDKLEGKKGMETLPILMEYSKKAANGREYTKEEQSAMLNAFLELLPEGESNKFRTVIKMMDVMNR